jgi:hypothetical protein
MYALRRAGALLAAALGTAVLCVAREAHAHPPLLASGVAWGSGDAFVVRTNRGLMFATGGSARLLCPLALGAFPSEELPVVATPRGWLVGTSRGVLQLDARGCPDRGALPLGQPGVQALVASGGAPGAPAVVVAITADARAGSALFRSTDAGSSFELADALPEREYFNSVALAADGSVLYLAGERVDARNEVSHFIAALSAGAELELQPIELEPAETLVQILAVDPADPDVVVAATFASSSSAPPSRLLRSEDAGHSWRTWHDVLGLSQLSFSADGQTAWLASQAGLQRSDAGGPFLSLPLDRVPSCAVPNGDQLIVCDALGLRDSRDGARSFAALLRFADVSAPVSCDPSGGALLECRNDWDEFAAEQARTWGQDAATAGLAAGASDTGAGAPGTAAAGAPGTAAGAECSVSHGRCRDGVGEGLLGAALLAALRERRARRLG